MSEIIKIQEEITSQLANKEVFNALIKTTFKGLDVKLVKTAMMEGMMRGFKFDDFLKKNIYAVPFSGGYSLITSIDYARKIGQRSGVNGKSKPKYTEDEKGRIKTCEITVYKKDGHPEGYTEEVWFDEYDGKRNLWVSKPRTMIAKVAEMHALRQACPEELSQIYTEEELEKSTTESLPDVQYQKEIDAIKTLKALRVYWKENRGKGKEFDEYITNRAEQLKASSKDKQDANS